MWSAMYHTALLVCTYDRVHRLTYLIMLLIDRASGLTMLDRSSIPSVTSFVATSGSTIG